MWILDDVLFVIFLLGLKPFQLKSLLFRLRVSKAKQLLVIQLQGFAENHFKFASPVQTHSNCYCYSTELLKQTFARVCG